MGRNKETVITTSEDTVRAREFVRWCGENIDRLTYYVKGGALAYDEDIFNDALVRAHDAIARRGTRVQNNVAYFLTTYRCAYLDSIKKNKPTCRVEDYLACDNDIPDTETYQEHDTSTNIKNDVLNYVRNRYDDLEVSLFEMYMGLYPDISYKRLSRMLGYPANKIWKSLATIRADIATEYKKTAY